MDNRILCLRSFGISKCDSEPAAASKGEVLVIISCFGKSVIRQHIDMMCINFCVFTNCDANIGNTATACQTASNRRRTNRRSFNFTVIIIIINSTHSQRICHCQTRSRGRICSIIKDNLVAGDSIGNRLATINRQQSARTGNCICQTQL